MKNFYIWKKNEFYDYDYKDVLRKETGWTCFAYSEGFKQVYNYFKSKKWCDCFEIVDSFDSHAYYSSSSTTLYIITNEKGVIIDYTSMIAPFSKRIPYEYRRKKHTRKRVHSASNHRNVKKEISDYELKYIRDKYLINIKQRKCYSIDLYDYYDIDYKACSKSWKDQSKRKHQYKNKNID